MPADCRDQTPEEAFSSLGNEIRVGILSALVDGERRSPDNDWMAFSELRQRVGVDDPSKFNYHLKRLRGSFVERGSVGYRLNNAGRHAVSAIRSGALAELPRRLTTSADTTCPDCNSPLMACYETDSFTVECPTHGVVGRLPLPPGIAFNRPVDELYRVASMFGDWYLRSVRQGICPLCWGQTTSTTPVGEPPENSEACAYAYVENQLLASFSCENCWMLLYAPIGAFVVDHPAVVELFFDNEVNLSSKSVFEIDFIWSPDSVRVVSDDPTRINLEVHSKDNRLSLSLDERTNVLDYEYSNCLPKR